MNLYFFDKYKLKGDKNSQNLLEDVLFDFIKENEIKNSLPFCIKKTKEGKPYLENSNINFSISHSSIYWACLVGINNEIGLDIQAYTKVDFLKIANRFFTNLEQAYISRTGLGGFLDIWVRKESYGKLKGVGLGKVLRIDCFMEDQQPSEKYNEVFFEEVFINNNLKCMCAMSKREEICIKKII